VGDAFSRYLRTSSDSEVLLNVFADALHKVRFSGACSQQPKLSGIALSLTVFFVAGAVFLARWCRCGCSDGPWTPRGS
jgi:hypothetical protein